MGGCWAAPEIDVGLFTTHWFINICKPGIGFSGNWVTAEMRGRYFNDDFPGNVGPVWVNHIVRIAHNDATGHIQPQGWAGASGGGYLANSLLVHGINTATRQASSNCYL